MRNRGEVGNFLLITDKVEKIVKVFEIALHKFEEDRFLEFVLGGSHQEWHQRACLEFVLHKTYIRKGVC